MYLDGPDPNYSIGKFLIGSDTSTGDAIFQVTGDGTFTGALAAYSMTINGVVPCLTNDSRLSDARPASDVYAWAKAAVKPSYTATEVGLGNVTNESKATMFTNPDFTGDVDTVGTTHTSNAGQSYAPINATVAGVQTEIYHDANNDSGVSAQLEACINAITVTNPASTQVAGQFAYGANIEVRSSATTFKPAQQLYGIRGVSAHYGTGTGATDRVPFQVASQSIASNYSTGEVNSQMASTGSANNRSTGTVNNQRGGNFTASCFGGGTIGTQVGIFVQGSVGGPNVNGTISLNQYGIYASYGSACTGTGLATIPASYGLHLFNNTGFGTISTLTHMYVESKAGPTVTNEKMLHLAGTTMQGSTSAWAIASDVSNHSYHMGNILVGSNTESGGNEKLQVTGNVVATGTVTAPTFAGNATTATTASNLYSAAGYISSSSVGTGYQYNIQIRENGLAGAQSQNLIYQPRLAFHWSGVVASCIGLEPSGRIAIINNPGTAYEDFAANNITATGNVTAYSDERLKKDWNNVTLDFVEKLAKVRAGSYSRIDYESRQLGVSAQDIQKIMPEVIMEDYRGYLSLAYGNAAMVSAVELAKEVVDLKKEVAELKEMIKGLVK
jgi:hypothetical protein